VPWLDTMAVENIVLEGTASSIHLDLTGSGSVDVAVTFCHSLQTANQVILITDQHVSIQGKHLGSIQLINQNKTAILSLSGEMIVFNGKIDLTLFYGSYQSNGYRYITLPFTDVLAVENIEVQNGCVLDFTGSILHIAQVNVTLDQVPDDVTINTGRIDKLSGASKSGISFVNQINVRLTGVIFGTLFADASVIESAFGDVFINRFDTAENLTLPAGVRIGILTVMGSDNITIDLSATQHAQKMILDMVGSLTVIVASFGTINDTKLIISGHAESVYFSGVGTVIQDGHFIVNDLQKDETIIFDTSGLDFFNHPTVILELSSIPVDVYGVPIFRKTNFTGTIASDHPRMTEIRFDSDIPFAHIGLGNLQLERYQNFLPVSTSSTMELINGDDDVDVKTYRNTGVMSFPVNNKGSLIAAIDTGPAIIEKFVMYRTMDWPLNQHGYPIVKVVSS